MRDEKKAKPYKIFITLSRPFFSRSHAPQRQIAVFKISAWEAFSNKKETFIFGAFFIGFDRLYVGGSPCRKVIQLA